MARDLRGRPEHLARFSDETTPDPRTTDRQKVPVYATVAEGTPIDWYDDLLARVPDAPEVKSRWVLAHFECLPRKTRGRVWRGLREVTIHISDPRPYLGRAGRGSSEAVRPCGSKPWIRMARHRGTRKSLSLANVCLL